MSTMGMAQRNVVVIGAAGVVGSGIVRKYLDAGARVVGVSRKSQNLDRLREKVAIASTSPFHGVVADFGSDAGADEARDAIHEALDGAPIDHVVTVQGFLQSAKMPTASSVDELVEALETGAFNNFRAAKVLVPAMKSRSGASFTFVSGGLAHVAPPSPGLWMGTVKNATLNALTYAFAAETRGDAVRVNTICIHFGVAPVGGEKNQFGMPAQGDTLRLAPAFLGVARSERRGEVICLSSWVDADALGR